MEMKHSGRAYHTSSEQADSSCMGCAFYRHSERYSCGLNETPVDIVSNGKSEKHTHISSVCSTNRIIWLEKSQGSPDATYSKEDITNAWVIMSSTGSPNVHSLLKILENVTDPEYSEYIRLQNKFGGRV